MNSNDLISKEKNNKHTPSAPTADSRPIVVLAAGGKGTRIRSLNSDVPKPMIPIAGKPILQWEIECLVKQGYTDIIITVSHLADSIIDYFGDGSEYGARIQYFNEETPLGNAGALFKLWRQGRLTATFLFLIADAIFDVDFDRFLDYHKSRQALATLFWHGNTHPQDSSLLVLGSDGRVEQWLNKEDERPEFYKNSVNAGLQILTLALLEESGIDPETVGVDKRVDLDRDILKPLVSTGRIYGYHSTEYCRDAGTPERFHAVEADLTSGLVHSRNFSLPQKAIFLDRDGTINKYIGFLRSTDEFELIDGVSAALRLINSSSYLAVICTNQPVIARGEVTYEQLGLIHAKMETLLGASGAYIDGCYFCPHHTSKGHPGEIPELKFDCACRKPKPGMLLQAAKDFNINLADSWMIGDGLRDIECGRNAGTKTILLTGPDTEFDHNEKKKESNGKAEELSDYTAKNLLEAVKIILGH